MSNATPAKRPTVVALLGSYCAMVMVVGFFSLIVGIVLIVFGDSLDSYESEDYYVGGGLIAFVGVLALALHAVPLFLKRDDTAWRVIYGFLIAYAVIWGVMFVTIPVLLFPVLLLSAWIRPNVKDYYGVVTEPVRDYGGRRRVNWDDGWDDEWDRPRR